MVVFFEECVRTFCSVNTVFAFLLVGLLFILSVFSDKH